jgi:ankyrin repeat protein
MVIGQACIEGDVGLLRQWARRGVRVTSTFPLYKAVVHGKLDVVRLLMTELGADASLLYNGYTVLGVAAMEGHAHVVRCLVQEFSANVNQIGENGGTALHAAAHWGNEHVVRCLSVECGANVNQATPVGTTALHTAAERGHEHVVRCLLGECGASINQPDVHDCTALYAAALEGHGHVVRCLVKEFGADVNLAADDGSTPLMVAVDRENHEVVVWLTKHGADLQALHSRGATAADISKMHCAPAEQTAYLEARTHCAKPGCSGAGLKKCAGCLVIFYCSKECQVAHWPAHKAECVRSAGKAADKGK